MRVSGKNKPGGIFVEFCRSLFWFDFQASVSVDSEETVASGLELISDSTAQVKLKNIVLSFSFLVQTVL